MFVEYQPSTPRSRALRPGAMIVLISVCPVFRSFPASGALVRAASGHECRNVSRQIRRGVRVRDAFTDRRIGVDHARGNLAIVFLERSLETLNRFVRGCFGHEHFRAAAPDHNEPIQLVLGLESPNIGDDLLRQILLVLPFLDVGAVEPLHVALIEHRRPRADTFKLAANGIEQ